MAKSTVTLASLDDIDQLFSTDVPKGAGDAAGASTSASAPPTSPMTSFLGERPSYADMKMDEPVLTTIMRDMARISHNTARVLWPFGRLRKEGATAIIRDWDLWGPGLFTVLLSTLLSLGYSGGKGTVFAIVFTILSLGTCIITWNVKLLGGSIIYLQAVCFVGYSLFPMNVGALLCLASSSKVYRSIVVFCSITWCVWASMPFIGSTVSAERKWLAVYPLLLLMATIGWLTLVMS